MNREEWRERENMYACWMCNFPGISNKQLYRLLDLCGGFEAAYLADREKWGQALSAKQVEELMKYTAGWRPMEEYRKMKEGGTILVTASDDDYPGRLKDIPDAPFGLFVRGKLPTEEAPAVAVVGARECSEYGKYVARKLGEALGRSGIVVVSGMAKGIDGISQEAALEAGGYSAAVLGNGVDVCYPAQNKALYEKLQKKGGILSAYPMGMPARPRNFPPRNRIVSGLADAVVVIEARIKSGTLITVDMALEQGREVYVVPGRVTDSLSDGCNRLIKQGANVLFDLEEFVEDIWTMRGGRAGRTENKEQGGVKTGTRQKTAEVQKAAAELPSSLAAVYEALDFYPKSIEEIGLRFSGEYLKQKLVTCLMQLCMENLAIQVSPGHFIRKS